MSISKLALITDALYSQHLTGEGHPECPKRYTEIFKALAPLELPLLQTRDATEDEVSLCHSHDYIHLVKEECKDCKKENVVTLSTGDVEICRNSYEVALRAIGGVLNAVDAVMQGIVQRVFCAVRPPGHHACPKVGMGFCLFNNIAIGARYAQMTYGIQRILIVDWDVHHGNGTQEIFYNDPSVYYFSTHEQNQYPGTGNDSEIGEEEGLGTTANIPIPATHDARKNVFKAFSNDLTKKMRRFRPELVMISAGFDAHWNDPIGNFNLTDQDFVDLTDIVTDIADKYSQGRVISVLEGGYHIETLGETVKAHVLALME